MYITPWLDGGVGWTANASIDWKGDIIRMKCATCGREIEGIVELCGFCNKPMCTACYREWPLCSEECVAREAHARWLKGHRGVKASTSESFLDQQMLSWIRDNLEPVQVYGEEYLINWMRDEGWLKSNDDIPTHRGG